MHLDMLKLVFLRESIWDVLSDNRPGIRLDDCYMFTSFWKKCSDESKKYIPLGGSEYREMYRERLQAKHA